MSGDEVFVLIFSAVIILWVWLTWYAGALNLHRLVCAPGIRRLLVWMPLICLVLLGAILKLFASFDVRDSFLYMFFYLVFGMAWVGFFMALPVWGVSARDDALERRNQAAAVTVAGLMLGVTLAFAGGNIGDGPGWWVVLFASGLATLALLVLWWMLNRFSNAGEHVTIDRDPASGWRAAGFLVGCGLVTGRAAAGDWVSAGATLQEFASGAWFGVVLLAAAVLLDRVLRPSPTAPKPSVMLCGVLPALALPAAAAADVVYQGWWK
jgi:hypothetical protein